MQMEANMDSMVFAKNLRKLRLEKNYTQEKVAEILMVSAQSVSRWECGNTFPDVMLLPEIAKVFEVTVDDLFKENILAYGNYAQRLLAVYESSGNTEDFYRAEKEFQSLFETNAYTADDLRSCGILYQYMMNYARKQAINCFDKVLMQNKKDDIYYRTWRQKISLYAQIGKSEKSIEIQSDALEKDYNNPEQWSLLIAAYYEAGENDKAYDWSMRAINKFSDNAMIFVYAGDICRNLKKYDEAFEYWNRALSLDDTFLDAKYSIGFCYEEIEEYEKAYETWKGLADELGKRGLEI